MVPFLSHLYEYLQQHPDLLWIVDTFRGAFRGITTPEAFDDKSEVTQDIIVHMSRCQYFGVFKMGRCSSVPGQVCSGSSRPHCITGASKITGPSNGLLYRINPFI